MNILHVIDVSYPMTGYGGTERVAYWLGKAQAELGHKVTYLCRPGSRLAFARTLPLPVRYKDLTPFVPPDTDIVQLYGTPRFRLDYPYLVNIGGNGKPGEKYAANTVFVSRDHADRHSWREFVYNGIDLAEYPLRRVKEDYALFLAKASWNVKNLAGAIRIARDARLGLQVAGGHAWFWKRGVKSHGVVDGARKLGLIQCARALLFPVIWNEPFGLAVVEALACGTPVVATPWGALSEIITRDCGILGESHDELVAGVMRAGEFDPDACRARVAEKFTHIHMAEGYLKYYKLVLDHGVIAEGRPEAPVNADPEMRRLYAGYCT